jgi:hypothetical protein
MMKYRGSCLAAVVAASVAAITPGSARAETPDPVVDKKTATDLVKAHDAAEVQRLKAELAKRDADEISYLIGKKLSDDKKALADKKQFPPIVPVEAPPANPCQAPQAIFVRRNSLDTFQLGGAPVQLSDAKGASASFAQDNLGPSTSTTVNARVEAVAYRYDPLSGCAGGKVASPWSVDPSVSHLGFAIGPFVDGQGTITNPMKKGEASALQSGVDLQFTLTGAPLFDQQYLTLTPYYQTDFRGVASVEGFAAFWDPIAPDVHLGGRIGAPDQFVDWFWQFRAAYDARRITNPGFTGLSNKSYDWVGAIAQVHIIPFPDLMPYEPGVESPFAAIAGRVFINGVVNYYWDANKSGSIHLYEVEFGYNMTADGKSSISVKYDNGTDESTLQAMKKYVVSLNYKY